MKTKMHTIEKKNNMYVNDYALKIKDICQSLASINVVVDDDEKVEYFVYVVLGRNTRASRCLFTLRRIS